MARRALLSVSDKTGIVKLAQQLSGAGYELISTGGTLAALQKAGVEVTPVETVTQFPEMLDGRVKTLHPMVHAGILARRDHPDHMEALAQHGITPIDIVVVNLYPFAETIAKPGVTLADAIEQIDIGGPSMIRAAAKNWRDVLVVTSPAQYEDLAEHVSEGTVSDHYRFGLAQAAFAHTAAYDAKIAQYLAAQSPDEEPTETPAKTSESAFPQQFELHMEKVMDLRYGENPHQQ
ncbi:MAG: bifunctional phosphoribosylaminoimidazolecarboxamide formyltransferase/IMP cyclohydrolase, partial [Negativicoccus succinicivorans]|nr:bifunctional phosphoribosylaminoimidazolecarboxamide formyltransferase/IMP cyclohydrolase [Negativicoccus succinicivorans]